MNKIKPCIHAEVCADGCDLEDITECGYYQVERTCHIVRMDLSGNPPYNKGDWIYNDVSDGCSECGYPFDTLNRGVPNFCQNCGAKVAKP